MNLRQLIINRWDSGRNGVISRLFRDTFLGVPLKNPRITPEIPLMEWENFSTFICLLLTFSVGNVVKDEHSGCIIQNGGYDYFTLCV